MRPVAISTISASKSSKVDRHTTLTVLSAQFIRWRRLATTAIVASLAMGSKRMGCFTAAIIVRNRVALPTWSIEYNSSAGANSCLARPVQRRDELTVNRATQAAIHELKQSGRFRESSRKRKDNYMQLNEAIDNNLAWATKRAEQDPIFFERLARGQKPSIVYIGCSDSRVIGIHLQQPCPQVELKLASWLAYQRLERLTPAGSA